MEIIEIGAVMVEAQTLTITHHRRTPRSTRVRPKATAPSVTKRLTYEATVIVSPTSTARSDVKPSSIFNLTSKVVNSKPHFLKPSIRPNRAHLPPVEQTCPG
ncbi:hypothetical protein [Nostoc sp. CHAB 5715]|uniref:hypothetical protein n=1 Tax=Nostoc sp. CHAB 5715 TaxID=2780400 RepID=UPI001E4C15D3|nr:hypothetical protein [Nostoc sp. CHAB 5715]MCC5622110.1 hypothetical protein [Nostoc sp. CHAB 5715]